MKAQKQRQQNQRFLSDNNRKQSQINTVVLPQKEMDRVGFEPTTSAISREPQKINYSNLGYSIKSKSFTAAQKCQRQGTSNGTWSGTLV
jgi:hypothetical protein